MHIKHCENLSPVLSARVLYFRLTSPSPHYLAQLLIALIFGIGVGLCIAISVYESERS